MLVSLFIGIERKLLGIIDESGGSGEAMKLITGENGLELVHPNGNWQVKKESGFSPVEMLVSSVAACSTYVYEDVLHNSKIPYELHEVEISYQRDSVGTVHPVTKIIITFHVTIPVELQERANRGLKLIPKHCPVVQALADTIVVEEKLICR